MVEGLAPAVSHRAESVKPLSATAHPHAPIQVKCRYAASSARVFDAWLDPHTAGQWLYATASRPIQSVRIDARVGGSFSFTDRRHGAIARYAGRYVEIAAHERLAFTLLADPLPNVMTRVTVAIATRGKGCELTLTHEDVPPDRAEPIEGRWSGILYGLELMLESTFTRSITKRSQG